MIAYSIGVNQICQQMAGSIDGMIFFTARRPFVCATISKTTRTSAHLVHTYVHTTTNTGRSHKHRVLLCAFRWAEGADSFSRNNHFVGKINASSWPTVHWRSIRERVRLLELTKQKQQNRWVYIPTERWHTHKRMSYWNNIDEMHAIRRKHNLVTGLTWPNPGPGPGVISHRPEWVRGARVKGKWFRGVCALVRN